MKIVQTLWTKPGLKAGWIDQRFHFFSWALSCLQLRKYYDEVELYTDSLGKQLLIDEFGLPYTKVHVVLDDFKYPTYLWASPKILTYSMQEKPFLHIDGDVYLFHPLHQHKISHEVVYQNGEKEMFDNGFYTSSIHQLITAAGGREQLPLWLKEVNLNHIAALNAGVLGGSDLHFFQHFADIAFDFLDNYPHVIGNMEHPDHANHITEQVLANYLLERNEGTKHIGLFETNYFLTPDLMHVVNNIPIQGNAAAEIAAAPVPFGYQALNNFGISPHGRKYVHMLGHNKKRVVACKLMAKRLRIDYPVYYQRILEFHGRQANTSFVQGFREKISSLTVAVVFRRTIHLWDMLAAKGLETALPLDVFIHRFAENVRLIREEWMRHRLEDIFHFENQRYQFALTLPDSAALEEAVDMSVRNADSIYDADQADLHLFQLSVNPFSHCVPVAWNWTDGNVLRQKDIAASPTVIVLLAEEITGSILELDLTPFNQIIYQLCREKRPYTELLEAFGMQLEGYTAAEVKVIFFQCVIYMITNNILFVHS